MFKNASNYIPKLLFLTDSNINFIMIISVIGKLKTIAYKTILVDNNKAC